MKACVNVLNEFVMLGSTSRIEIIKDIENRVPLASYSRSKLSALLQGKSFAVHERICCQYLHKDLATVENSSMDIWHL